MSVFRDVTSGGPSIEDDPQENCENIYHDTQNLPPPTTSSSSSSRLCMNRARLSSTNRRKGGGGKRPDHTKRHKSSRDSADSYSDAFRELRDLLPTPPHEKDLSRVEILRLATCYISYLNAILERNPGMRPPFKAD